MSVKLEHDAVAGMWLGGVGVVYRLCWDKDVLRYRSHSHTHATDFRCDYWTIQHFLQWRIVIRYHIMIIIVLSLTYLLILIKVRTEFKFSKIWAEDSWPVVEGRRGGRGETSSEVEWKRSGLTPFIQTSETPEIRGFGCQSSWAGSLWHKVPGPWSNIWEQYQDISRNLPDGLPTD